jgi:hypothetical protein
VNPLGFCMMVGIFIYLTKAGLLFEIEVGFGGGFFFLCVEFDRFFSGTELCSMKPRIFAIERPVSCIWGFVGGTPFMRVTRKFPCSDAAQVNV